MVSTRIIAAISILMIAVSLAVSAFGRTDYRPDGVKGLDRGLSASSPAHQLAGHRVGKIELGVNNNGTFGNQYTVGPTIDCFTGDVVPSCEYPKNSDIQYLYGAAFWIGAVVGRDTLVSVGADGWQWVYEMFPDESPFGDMVFRSISDPEAPEYEDAISEEDYIAVYTDTYTEGVENDFFGRPHNPLGIEATQASYAWSYAYAEDFVLFDYQIKNIGTDDLHEVFMGIYVDADVSFDAAGIGGATDDICGFLPSYSFTYGACDFEETVFAAWIADNDGDFERTWDDGSKHPCPHITATRIVRTPREDSLDVSFNWWIGNGNPSLDFGPRERPGVGRLKEPIRDFRTGGMGTPEGDLNKYYVMSNREFDYKQIYTGSIQPNDTLWQYPDQSQANNFSDGYDTRYLLSFGPFEIEAGQTLPISFAYVAGENLHTSSTNASTFLPHDPYNYEKNLDFSDLALNSRWASWVYDNPGVDTDGDDYFGKSHVCCTDSAIVSIDTITEDPLFLDTTWEYTVCDTFFYEGDGVPDFRGAAPPPAPEFWVEPTVGMLKVHFNGLRSEIARDVFSREVDFEGYRVYIARDERAASYYRVASYDRENYNKYVFNPRKRPQAGYELLEKPFTIEELRCLYGRSCDDLSFDPLNYTMNSAYIHPKFPDSIFYFDAQDYNVSQLGVVTPIRKEYPDQPYPSVLNPEEAMPEELTDDGHLKYFQYEIVIDDLLPTVPYWVNITAFDYGSPESGLASLETSVTVGAKIAYPLSSWNEVQRKDLKVYVYPNPYRLDGGYRDRGFEGRMESNRPPDRTREINFANLPPKCTIRIYTLDGDLVREIKHEKNSAEADASHETWNMITRNTQMVVSGLYYWTVESEYGETQIGKLVIIM